MLVVVAEILFNRLLHREAFDFTDVSAVVMDEFHSFNDYERGIVWELSLGLLPPHVRMLLLSATVGNSVAFINWLRRSHNRKLELVQGDERRVPLTFQWVPDKLLTEQLEGMAQGDDESRMTPALVFCFNREQCWTVAEQLKGKKVLSGDQQARLNEALSHHDWSRGAGPKLRQVLQRGVGVHHAGVLPKYRRIVEELFQRKLLSVTTCTETLAAGINLPARSVVVPELMKGPPGKKRLLDPNTAHQIFGRAGRPQFDTHGYIYCLAHEDDVRIARWRDEYDKIPEDTKDPGLMKAKKRLKKKMPKRRTTEQYWNEEQYEKLKAAPAAHLASRGELPWRLLAYMLDASPEVDLIRDLVGRRLMDPKHLEMGQKMLDRMLLTLHRAGYVTLEPEPPTKEEIAQAQAEAKEAAKAMESKTSKLLLEVARASGKAEPEKPQGPPPYKPMLARPTEKLALLSLFRGVNPLYGVFLVEQLGIADRAERIQALESVLELPGSVAHFVRVPRQDQLPPGPLAKTRLDEQLLQRGLATPDELVPSQEERDPNRFRSFDDEPKWVLTLAEKLWRLFDFEFPDVHDLRTTPVWAAGEVLEFGDFDKYVTSKSLQKQEGMVFRHLLRLILLIAEFAQLSPPDGSPDEWRADLDDVAARLTEICRQVDPTSTEKTLAEAAM
ncbi:MAG: helicase [Planctomycetia bacterium]|nr:helicase [Planctomycetia bacterium]